MMRGFMGEAWVSCSHISHNRKSADIDSSSGMAVPLAYAHKPVRFNWNGNDQRTILYRYGWLDKVEGDLKKVNSLLDMGAALGRERWQSNLEAAMVLNGPLQAYEEK